MTQCLSKIAEINEFSASDEMLWVTRQTGRQQVDCSSCVVVAVVVVDCTVTTTGRHWWNIKPLSTRSCRRCRAGLTDIDGWASEHCPVGFLSPLDKSPGPFPVPICSMHYIQEKQRYSTFFSYLYCVTATAVKSPQKTYSNWSWVRFSVPANTL